MSLGAANGGPAPERSAAPAAGAVGHGDETPYGEDYFSSRCGDRPYRKGETTWEDFFSGIADNIVRSFGPRTVFDAGCALGFLVEALWDRGVVAHGRDISAYAISQVRPDVREYCTVGSLTDPIDGRFDLVVCIDVVEHLAADDADRAIEHLTAASDRILFSSTPSDFGEPTHRTVRPPIYWLRRFAERGFAPALAHDASYVSPQAVVLERSSVPIADDLLLGAAELARLRLRLHDVHDAHPRRGPRTVTSAGALAAQRELEHRFTTLARELQVQRREADAARGELRALEATRVLRYSKLLRSVYGRLRRAIVAAPGAAAPRPLMPRDPLYELWISQFDEVDDQRRRALAERLAALTRRPLVSVLMPVFDTPERYLREAIDSVRSQLYGDWELCAVDDCSTAAWVPKVLEEYAARDARIRVVRREVNGHISAASNTALDMARGEWLVLLDHDDTLSEHALALGVLALTDSPGAGLLYSDEDKIDDSGHRSMPYFKPDFDPLLLLSQNYVCHMTMVRRDLVHDVGGFREGLEGSQDWDLVLRTTERLTPDQVVHVPHVLYHWRAHEGSTAWGREAKPYATHAGARAVRDHLDHRGGDADVLVNEVTGIVRAKWRLPAVSPKVSIVIPTRDGKYLGRCLASLFSTTDYPSYEVVLVDNGSVSDAARRLVAQYEGVVTILREDGDDRPFNLSALRNAGAHRCSGQVLCFLDDDCELIEHGWLEELVAQVSQDGVGAVGAKLIDPEGRVQHAGLVLGNGDVAGHPQRLFDGLGYGYFGWLQTPRSLSAVTAACMVVRRSVFERLGGFDEVHLAVACGDVDFCLRAREAGWRVVWTPYAVVMHHESISRGHDPDVRPDAFGEEVAYMERRWAHLLRSDPAYNPNLSLEDTEFSLAFPPRSPWWAA